MTPASVSFGQDFFQFDLQKGGRSLSPRLRISFPERMLFRRFGRTLNGASRGNEKNGRPPGAPFNSPHVKKIGSFTRSAEMDGCWLQLHCGWHTDNLPEGLSADRPERLGWTPE
jgi:hypothetical protein